MADDRSVYFGDDFGQKIDLTVRIREILRNYPEGTSIFKELVQNADDAGATEVSFCLDLRHHGSDSLAYKKLDVFQGPSLLVHNNATFSDTDFRSIQRLGDSLKKDTSRGWKTGRFGIGFNSVYHLTDLPAFVSGSHLVFFDPQACHLPNVNPSNPGKMINFVSHPDFVSSHPDQLAPFRVFGCDFSTPYNGTVFRLALRTDEQARVSRLSSRTQSPEHMAEMLSEFGASLHLVLLFLRNVSKIRLMKWIDGDQEPSLMTEASIINLNPQLEMQRSLKMARISEQQKFEARGEESDMVLDIVIQNAEATGPRHVRYHVANQLGGGDCSRIANDPNNASQRLVPWGGVAVRVPDSDDEDASERGLAFCFLPLPTYTYLPVHVNGYFELSSNRRDIWYGDSLSGDGLLRAQWNEALLRDVIAPCYARVLVQLADEQLLKPKLHAQLFPSMVPPAPWDGLAREFLALVKSKPCLYSSANGGSWLRPTDSLLVSRTTENYEAFVSWVLEDNLPVVTTLTSECEEVLVKFGRTLKYVTPDALRVHYRGCSSKHAGNTTAMRAILGFAARDLVESSSNALVDVKLLPLCNKTVIAFQGSQSLPDTGSLDHLCSMGFSRSDAIRALRQVGGANVEAALNMLVSRGDPSATVSSSEIDDSKAIYLPSDEELYIFRKAQDQLVDVHALPPLVLELLKSPTARAVLNVRTIDIKAADELFSSILPSEWLGRMKVSWTTEDSYYADFDELWFRALWKYLAPSPDLRALQDKWPILPTESRVICNLNPSAGVVNAELLPPGCLAALTKLNVPVLLKNLFASVQPHTDIWNYVNQPTAGGVLSSLVRICEEPDLELKRLFKDITRTERDQLRSFLLSGVDEDDFSTPQRSVFMKLPVFEGLVPVDRVVDADVMCKANASDDAVPEGYALIFVGTYSPVSRSTRVSCPGMRLELLDDTFLYVRDHDEVLLAALDKLDVRVVSKFRFFSDHLIPRLQSISLSLQSRIKITRSLLQELGGMMAGGGSGGDVATLIEHAPIFPALSGELKRIADLFDPDVDEFRTLMDDSFFPASELQDPQPLSVLRSLGLQRNMSRRSILTLACSIENEQERLRAQQAGEQKEEIESLRSALEQRALAFFKYVDSHIDQLTSITDIKQVPGKKNLKTKSIKLFRSLLGDGTGSHSSSSSRERDMVASEEVERRIAEQGEIDDFVAKMGVISWVLVSHEKPLSSFPWLADDGTVVAAPSSVRLPKDRGLCSSQRYIVNNAMPTSATLRRAFHWDSQLPFEVVALQLKAIVSSIEDSQSHLVYPMIYDIYATLSIFFEVETNRERCDAVIKLLNGDVCSVLVGRRFVAPHRVALTTRVNAEPFLFAVPNELLHFRPLLKAIGVRERFSLNDFVDALRLMFFKSQPPTQADEQPHSVPLSEDEIASAIGLVQLISDKLPHHSDFELYAPNAKNVLMRTVRLTFDDAPWISKGEVDLETVCFIHPKISNEVASKIGAVSLRSSLLHSSQSDNLFAGVEAFGQSEALTKRISHILEQYPDGPHILSELIQNADDAGATRVCFLYSDHNFGTSSLLSPAMAKWQGPALYCYNDAEFKESDFISLARIGQAGKLQRVSTTGRFGLGFNSVYHFTDLPSVVSADSLVMFDPHASNLPGISPANPGIRVRFVNSTLPAQFPDQFEPFKLFGCDMQHRFQGSIFRFPLRNADLSGTSEIKQRAYTKHDILSLFSSFRETISDAMIFLRNVRTVEVMVQGDTGAPPALLFSADVPEEERKYAAHKINSFLTGGVQEDLSRSTKRAFYSRLENTPVEDLPSVTQVLHIHTREVTNLSSLLSGTRDGVQIRPLLSEEDTTHVTKTDKLLVCNQIGGGRAREMACDPANESLKLIPWVGIAGRLQSEVAVTGRAFCFLPLPVRTGLPVHVNGYFELSSNRRDIWHGDDLTGDGKLRSEWNESLLTDAIAPAYATFLLEAKKILSDEPGHGLMPPAYLALFPTVLPRKPWDSVVSSLYELAKDRTILTTSPTSVHNPLKPITPIKSVLVDEAVEQWEELEVALSTVFIDTVRLPTALRQLMTELSVVRGSFTPRFFRKLVRSDRFLQSLDRVKATSVIRYCLSDARDAAARADLNGLQIIPVLDGSFKPLCLYSGEVTEPVDEASLFFATKEEGALLSQFHDRLVSYEVKALVDEIPTLFATSNLFKMNLEIATRNFLPKMLPRDWSRVDQGQEVYWWEPEQAPMHPSRTWLHQWWQYVGDAVDESVGEDQDRRIQEAIVRLPLLPLLLGADTSRQILIRVGAGSKMAVVPAADAISPPDVLPPVFSKLGVATVDATILSARPIVDWLVQRELLFRLDLDGFLVALSNRLALVESVSVHDAVGRLSHDERQALTEFVTSGSFTGVASDNVALLEEMPIFRVYPNVLGGEDSDAITYRAIGSETRLPSEDAVPSVLDNNFFVAAPLSKTRSFLRDANVSEWSFTRILLDHVFPRLEEWQRNEHLQQLSDPILREALLEYSFHQRQDTRFRESIRSLPIIPSSRRVLRRVCDLYDPDNKDLAALVGSNSLPHPVFSGQEILDVLRTLGLRGNLSCHAILEAARSVEAMAVESQPYVSDEAWAKASSLLKVVNTSFDSMATKFLQEPATENGGEAALDQLVSDLCSVKWLPVFGNPPSPLMPWRSDNPTSGGGERRIASPDMTRPGSDAWMCSLSLNILKGQLDSQALVAGFGWDRPVEVATIAAQLIAIGEQYSQVLVAAAPVEEANRLRHEVQRMYTVLDSACTTTEDDDAVASVVGALGSAKWVWNGDKFLYLNQIAMEADAELEPVLYTVPPSALVPRSLLIACGLKERFGPVDYLFALHKLSEEGSNGVPSELLPKCIKLLGHVADALRSGGEDIANLAPSGGFLLVDDRGVLVPARELVVDDMEWDESAKIRRGSRLVHKLVPAEIALTLGAKSLHSTFAETKVTSVQCKCPSTNALHKVLPDRKDWINALFTEVLLATERMGGSQVDFYVDHRKHASQRVIHPSLNALQDESICIHIHGLVLSVDDVSRLYRGEVSRPGFLAGFAVADCLQILSGTRFFILDPASKFLPSVQSDSPRGTARCYDIMSEDFRRYPDQIMPFSTLPSCPGSISSCGLHGTLLRFPLRKSGSEISNFVLQARAMSKLATRLARRIEDCLVFTESIHRVSISSVGEGSDYAVVVNGEVSLVNPDVVLQRRNATRQNTEWRKKFSIQSLFRPQVTPESQLEFVVKVERDNKRYHDTWLVSDNIGVGRSRDLASTPVHETLGSIPFVSVATRILRNGDPVRPFQGKIWKLVESYQAIDLPVHVSGCFKKNLCDREVLFDSPSRSVVNDEQTITAHWNRVLLEDGAVEAYWKLLALAKSRFERSVPKGFYSVWPTVQKANILGGQVQSRLYRKLTTEEFFLCTDGQFRALSGGYIVDYAGMDLQVVSFAQLHFPSFDIPQSVLEDTQRLLSSRVYTLSPRALRQYLRKFRPSDIDASMCLSLLEYCLSDLTFPLPGETHVVWTEFQQLPLLPLQDGTIGLLGTMQRGRYVLGTFNQVQLLHSASNMFVSLEARQRLHAFFSDARFVTQMGLSHFSIKTLADNLDKVLPPEWNGASIVDWKPETNRRHVSREWMHRFWSEVHFERRSLAYFSAWCLVPVQGSRLQSCGKPDASICVWQGSLDAELRENVVNAALASDEANELCLAASDSERLRLRQLAAEKQAQEAADQFLPSLDDGDHDTESRASDSSDDEDDSSNHEVERPEVDVQAFATEAETEAPDATEVPMPSDDASVEDHREMAIPFEANPAAEVAVVDAVEAVEFCPRDELHALLFRLNVSLIELAYFKGQEANIIPSGQDVAVAVLDCIWSSDSSALRWSDLPVTEATKLAEYFSDHSQRHGSFNRMHIDRLKRLPIYRNIGGLACSLHLGEHFLVPEAIDLTRIPLPSDAQERFLVSNPRLSGFYRELGVTEMSYPKLLLFVLPTYHNLLPDQCESILSLIKERWPSLRRESDLVTVLRGTPLFRDQDGAYQCASAFLDPRNRVLRAVFATETDKFPIEPFNSSTDWLDLMGEIGLRSEITVQLFIECARRLEALYAGKSSLSPQEEATVGVLHSFFVQNFDKYDRSRVFFDEITSIRFVPATKFDNAVGGSNGPQQRSVLVAYTECVTPSDQALTFTCMPVLSAAALPPRVLWSRLSLQSPPPMNLVLQHLYTLTETGVGSSIEESWRFFQPVVQVFQQLFKYLQDHWDRLEDGDRTRLMNTAIIPVGTTLVKGHRLFFHLAENLAPLMYEVPRVFGAYDTLFRQLGTKESPQGEDFILLLRELADECGDQPLNLNELLCVVRIIGLLADGLLEQNKTLAWQTQQHLYLPNTDSIMRRVGHMAYNDAPWMCTRIDLTKLQIVHPRVSVARCDALGIRGISRVVEEELEPGQVDAETHDAQQRHGIEVTHLNQVLQSQQFGDGLRTVISVQQQKMASTTTAPADFADLHRRINDVSTFSVRLVETLCTRFMATLGYPSRREDVTKSSTATGSMCFVDTPAKVIFVATKTLDEVPGIRLTQVVAGCVNQLLGGFVHDGSVIESMLSSELLAIPELLRVLHIQEDPQLISEKLRGTCGEQLSEQDMVAVELAPLRSFFVGELVAIEQGHTLVYAKVVAEKPADSSGGVNHVQVRLRQAETHWLPATQVFSFRPSRGHARPTEEPSRRFVESLHLLAQPHASGDVPVALPAAVVARPGGAMLQADGPVSTVTVIAAVNDLLSKVNMSLTSPYEELVAENERLKQRLEQAEEARRITATQVDAALRKEKEAEEALVCTICLEHQVDRVLVPCGHIYCSGCVAQLPRPTCPMCRQGISSSAQFHLPS